METFKKINDTLEVFTAILKGNHHISVDTKLKWELSDNGRQFIYTTQCKNKKVNLIRNYHQNEWFGIFEEPHKYLPLEPSTNINEYVLEVEKFLKSI